MKICKYCKGSGRQDDKKPHPTGPPIYYLNIDPNRKAKPCQKCRGTGKRVR